MGVTVCTPTYNREKLIPDLYESLKKQTCKDFEWIVVDDGSSDNTEVLFKKWIQEKKFKIIYKKKQNGGKHTALNLGIELAREPVFMIVDSDDYLRENAIERVLSEFSKLVGKKYAGVGFLKAFENEKIVGSTFHGAFLDCSSLERDKYSIVGDKAEVFYTDILRKYKFPVFENERFLPESLVWYRIANDGYIIHWVNQPIYICRYQENGLSMNAGMMKSQKGYTLAIKELQTYHMPLSSKLKPLGVYCYSRKKMGHSYRDIAKDVGSNTMLLLLLNNVYKIKQRLSHNRGRKRQLMIREGQ